VDYQVALSSFSNDVTPQTFTQTTGMWMLGATVAF
jgi:hypothetical protein